MRKSLLAIMLRKVMRALMLLVALVASVGATAEVRLSRLDDKERFADIDLQGEITNADVEQFQKMATFLVRHFDTVTVHVDSPGGDLLAAIEIGDILRANWIWTVVDDNTECSSACVFILAAGAKRIAGDMSLVRIHRPHFEAKLFGQLGQSQAKAKYDGLIDDVRKYLSRMGMSEQLFQAMMAVRSDDARKLTVAEMKAVSLVGEDPGYVEWMRAKHSIQSAQ
jgi:hypothetical protein